MAVVATGEGERRIVGLSGSFSSSLGRTKGFSLPFFSLPSFSFCFLCFFLCSALFFLFFSISSFLFFCALLCSPTLINIRARGILDHPIVVQSTPKGRVVGRPLCSCSKAAQGPVFFAYFGHSGKP